MNFSVFALLLSAFSTKSKILETVESPNVDVVFILIKQDKLMQPLNTSSSTLTLLGIDSPVRAVVFKLDLP